VEHPFGLVEDDTVVIKLLPHGLYVLPHLTIITIY